MNFSAFKITTTDALKEAFDQLLSLPLASASDVQSFIRNRSDLESAVEEEGGWRYIQSTLNTADEDAAKRYEEFFTEFYPLIAEMQNKLNTYFLASPALASFNEPGYQRYVDAIKRSVRLFREENIPIETQLQALAQQYGAIAGAMEVEFEGETMTMQKASSLLKDIDRTKREAIWKKISSRRAKDRQKLNEILSEMIQLRHKIALNAGFNNYRDYKFEELGRTDYTPADCIAFHKAVREVIVPINAEFAKSRKEKLGYSELKPWDLKVDPEGKQPLKPFQSATELIEKGHRVFDRIDPRFANWLTTMESNGRLDLESKPGKAPGGYQYPLPQSGIPFIFMNAVGTMEDLSTLMHEMGHAIHTDLSNHLPVNAYKNPPMEVAELASMSMELISMEAWDEFFAGEELDRAKKFQLKDALSTLPWIALVDAFQHWLYLNPNHSADEREAEWSRLFFQYTSDEINYFGLEDTVAYQWQAQLHIYEVPFYYIEYGFAQLGAMAMWRNVLNDKEKGLDGYCKALSLGNTQSIPEVYEAGGIRFDFSKDYIGSLADFVMTEYRRY